MFVPTEAPMRVSQQLAECSTEGAETRTNIVMWWNVKDLITVWNYVLGRGGRGVAVKPGGTGWEALSDKDMENIRWEEWRVTSEGWCHSPVVRMSPVAVVEVLSAPFASPSSPPSDLCGELWELSPEVTPHTAALHKDACLECEWRLLTLTTQDGKKEEEEEEEESLSSSCHCILDDVMWNFTGSTSAKTFFFLG